MASYKERMLIDARIKDYYLNRGIKPAEVDAMKSRTLWALMDIQSERVEQQLFTKLADENRSRSADSVKHILEMQKNARELRKR